MAITDKSLEKFREIFERDSKRKWSDDEVRDSVDRLTRFCTLIIDMYREEKLKEKKLEEFPNGYHLEDRDGQYHCNICYRYITGEETWYDKYGLKCMDCQKNIDNGTIPGEICKDEDLWLKGWQLKSDLGIHPMTAKKLGREGKLKMRNLIDATGKPYFQVYLISENKAFLKTVKWKKKNRTNPIMVDEKGIIF